jgi:hypothetical protein
LERTVLENSFLFSMAKKEKKITENSTLAEILDIPGAEKILASYNLPCLSCPLAGLEMQELKLEEVCRAYWLNLKDILKELQALSFQKKG